MLQNKTEKTQQLCWPVCRRLFVLHMQCHGRLGKLKIQCHCQSNSAPMKEPNVKRNWKKAQLTLRQAYIPRYWRWARETFNKFHVQCQSLNVKKAGEKLKKKQTNKAKLVHFWLKLKAVNHVYFQRWKICVLFEQKFQHSDKSPFIEILRKLKYIPYKLIDRTAIIYLNF